MALVKILDNAKFFGKTKFGTEAGPSYDDAAAAYIAAVEAADGQALETSVKTAYNDFIVGCKADGIWSALKASCIMAGARTLNGALVPLVGTAPTNFNFVSADYNRKIGLIGNGSTKYLNSNRNNNTDPQNSNHNAVVASVLGVSVALSVANDPLVAGSNFIGLNGIRNRNATGVTIAMQTGFNGTNRSSSSQYISRRGGTNTTHSSVSQTPASQNITLFKFGTTFGGHRLSFYSIGESLDLAKLDTRVSALMTAINSAI